MTKESVMRQSNLSRCIATVLCGLGVFGAGLAVASTHLNTPSARGTQPTAYVGNFVSSDDVQVCYDMAASGHIHASVAEGDVRGFKIDPPDNYTSTDGLVTATVSNGGKWLAWDAPNATVHAVIVKGGPGYNLYDYVNSGFKYDSELHSPYSLSKNGRVVQQPQISHYNFCYTPERPETEVPNGCTPGYWRNHADRWFGVAPGDVFNTVFGVTAYPGLTLGQAIALGGGDLNALARHATAALLNALGGVPNADDTVVEYQYTESQVKAMVQAAVAGGGDVAGTKDLFAAANEAGCPLSGTRAVKVQ
jgi:hypothetical protein